MRTRVRFVLVALASAGLWGCGLFDDPTPETIFLTIGGPAGSVVELHVARNFVAGVDEVGVTRVQVFSADTVRMTLPVDTTFNIALQQRFFLQMLPTDEEQLADVKVRVDVDGRNLYDDTGDVFVVEPFRFVYVFNQRTTVAIELL